LAGGDYEEQVQAALEPKRLQIDPPAALKLFTPWPSYPKGGMLRMLPSNKRTKVALRALAETPDEAESMIWKR
jgi:hypothetical protein